jgi:hypothetical protein
VRILKNEEISVVSKFVEDSEVFPLDIFYYNIFRKNNKLRNRIIWHLDMVCLSKSSREI